MIIFMSILYIQYKKHTIFTPENTSKFKITDDLCGQPGSEDGTNGTGVGGEYL